MIDAEAYVFELGTRDLAAKLVELAIAFPVRFAADIDVDQIEQLPAITFTVTGDGQVANGNGLWSFVLNFLTFGDGMDQAKRFARIGYDLAHYWDDRSDLTELDIDGETVWVSSVEDIDLPSRLSSAEIDGRNVVQYAGSFALDLRS